MLSNGIPAIKEMTVQKYDLKNDAFEDGWKVIRDKNELENFRKILNRAKHEKNVRYEMARHEDYKVTVTFTDNTQDVFMVWKNSGKYIHMIRQDSFKVSHERDKMNLLKILDS
ncbi:hypothetical protein [Peribacillus alkalitolerans]|uniref:hypothetical protein n=1 Tax=Peribacillus alkalitolerans TaxID=1550385 RepID=UPI0013D51322|nr:hypothetical protein [Peribacillus alkalitolerans]